MNKPIGLVVVALFLAGCGSSSTASSAKTSQQTSPSSSALATTTTVGITLAAAGSQYLAAAAPVNTVLSNFSAKANAWTSSTTDAQAEADAAPLIAALQTFGSTLTNDTWPSNTVADIHALVQGDAAEIGDLEALANVNFLNSSTWIQGFSKDATVANTDVSLVRKDLNLPQVTK